MAYEIKGLVEKLKAQGQEVAEESAKIVLSEVLDWVVEEALKSENKLDDMLAVVIPVAKSHLMELAEDINKADNPVEPAE